MADKLKDQEIADQLKHYGETVKLPIDYKRRPILIKKLNHYRARENPPPKRGRSAGRAPKRPVAPVEFSDDSQDEGDTESNLSRNSVGRNVSRRNAKIRDSPVRRTRSHNQDNGANVSSHGLADGTRSSVKHKATPQIEIFPDEFSDNDTADESIYVEEKSIGINTSMNFDDTFDEDELTPSYSVRPKRRTGAARSPKARNSTGNNYVSQVTKTKASNGYAKPDTEQFISKTILIVVGVFFLLLALSYVYVKRDTIFPTEKLNQDLKDYNLSGTIYPGKEVKIVLDLLQKLHGKLARMKGDYELENSEEDKKQMDRQQVEELVEREANVKEEMTKRYLDLMYHLILKKPEWDIMALSKNGSDADSSEEISYLESKYSDLPLFTRLRLAVMAVLYGLVLIIVLLCVGMLMILYMRWQNSRREKEQQKVYDMVEEIIEMLRNHSEMAEKKNDQKNYPPYLAVQHIRDQLIPVAKRRKMQALWEDAVKFIESNESRIRVETQVIQGEEFTVWRWLQSIPNGHKAWQGQAFGETSLSNVNTLAYGPTPCLKVRNMFDANMEQSTDDWHVDIEESILEKCENNNGILHIFVDRSSREGCVYIKCSSCEKAYEAYQSLHGWWFDGRLVTVKYLRLEHYHDRFPDSRNKRHPLRPTKNGMQSVAQPYHRSVLEVT